jgi:Tol biopolymer transport system component
MSVMLPGSRKSPSRWRAPTSLIVVVFGTALASLVPGSASGGSGAAVGAVAPPAAVAFAAPDPDVGDVDSGLAMIDTPTGTRRWLLGADAHDADWLPDGRGVVYATPTGIWQARADGTGRRRVIADGAALLGNLDVSPNGVELVYEREFEIWTAALDGTSRRMVVDGEEPAWAPDGTRIAYVRGEGDIVVADIDGRNAKRIASSATSPSWSPDGRRIAFSWDGVAAGQQGIFTMRPDGTDKRRISPGFVYADVAWSPDGRQFAVADLDGDVFLVPATGGKARRMTRTDVAETDPAWHPDGRALTITSGVGSEILRAVPGNASVRLTREPGPSVAPAWAPDGARIAYLGPGGELYVVAATGGAPRKLTTGLRAFVFAFATVRWSPDGSRIITVGARGLRSVGATDGRTQVLGDADIAAADWSPDGERIAATSLEGVVSIIPSDGRRGRAITKGFDSHHVDWAFVDWSPDGTRIALTLEGRRRPVLRILDPAGRVIRTVTGANPSWSADGSALAFERYNAGSSRIWLVNRDGRRARLVAHGAFPRWTPEGRVSFVRADGVWTAHPTTRRPVRVVRAAGVESIDWRPAR